MKTMIAFMVVLGFVVAFHGPTNAQSVGITWTGASKAQDTLAAALEAKLKSLSSNAVVEIVPELPNIDALGPVISRFEEEKDALVVLRFPGSRFLSTNQPSKPTFVGIARPESTGVIENIDEPEGNITGVTAVLPLEVIAEVISALNPEATPLLIVGDSTHVNTQFYLESYEATCEALFIECTYVAGENLEAVATELKEKAPQYGGVLLDQTALTVNVTETLLAAAGSTPVYGMNRGHATRGVIAAVASDFRALGELMAEQIYDVHTGKRSIAQTPLGTVKPELFINEAAVDASGLPIPRAMREVAIKVD